MTVLQSRYSYYALMISAAAIFLTAGVVIAQDEARPKYGPAVTRLYHARQFIQREPAPDYWALSPYYVSQPNDSSCSAATLAMLVNALRADRKLAANEQLATPESVVKLVDRKLWQEKIADEGPGVTLDELGGLARRVLDSYEMRHVRVEVIRLPDDQDAAAAQLRKLLAQNERAAGDFLAVNFLQSELTGDPAGAVGHMAPIAAFDAAAGRVLILDPDRSWYEPYWVSEASLLAAVATKDPDTGRPRGLLRVWRP